MPITPLHFGALAPLNYWWPGRVSNASFILANILMDLEAILHWIAKMPLPAHTWMTHSFAGACGVATITVLLGTSTRDQIAPRNAWVWGAFLGAFSHVFLDMLVHPEMLPLYPKDGNPFYMGWMEPISWIAAPFLVWLVAQYVSYSLGWVRRRYQASPSDCSEQGNPKP